jgi:1-acylglycerone phosphate reductase
MSDKRSVLITGCSDGGAGSALAAEFQSRGFIVFATSRRLDTMSVIESLPNVKLLQFDITESADIRAAVEAVSRETGGSLNYLINCAARNYFMPLLDQDIEAAKELYNLNVWAPLAVTQAFAPLLIKAKGTITFITSLAGYLNVPYQGKSLAHATVVLLRLGMHETHVNRCFCCVKTVRRDHGRDASARVGPIQRQGSVNRDWSIDH